MWGVTVGEDMFTADNYVSIHTPVWGVTSECITLFTDNFVSIHTPVWGVTFGLLGTIVALLVFQSTRPCGA